MLSYKWQPRPRKGLMTTVLHSVGDETDEENDDKSFMAGDAIGRLMRG